MTNGTEIPFLMLLLVFMTYSVGHMDINFLNFVTTAGFASRLDFSTCMITIISKIE